MNAERMASIFAMYKKAERRLEAIVAFHSRRQEIDDPWGPRHINHPVFHGTETWLRWASWTMRLELLKAKLENRAANHYFNPTINIEESERRNKLARERFEAKRQKPLVLPRPCTVEGYHIDEAYIEEVPSGRHWEPDECAFAADEVIEALKTAGIEFTIKE